MERLDYRGQPLRQVLPDMDYWGYCARANTEAISRNPLNKEKEVNCRNAMEFFALEIQSVPQLVIRCG